MLNNNLNIHYWVGVLWVLGASVHCIQVCVYPFLRVLINSMSHFKKVNAARQAGVLERPNSLLSQFGWSQLAYVAQRCACEFSVSVLCPGGVALVVSSRFVLHCHVFSCLRCLCGSITLCRINYVAKCTVQERWRYLWIGITVKHAHSDELILGAVALFHYISDSRKQMQQVCCSSWVVSVHYSLALSQTIGRRTSHTIQIVGTNQKQVEEWHNSSTEWRLGLFRIESCRPGCCTCLTDRQHQTKIGCSPLAEQGCCHPLLIRNTFR